MTNSAKNKLIDKSFFYWGIFSTSIGLILLAIFIGYIMYIGLGRINGDFFTSFPSRFPEKAGIFTALLGSVWILVLTLLFAFPIGVAAAIYLEEYQTKGKFSTLLEINISNLAGIPSIILRAFGIEVFARFFGFGGSLVTGALTLSLLVLPIIIVSTREAIKAVPSSIKDASYAMGATKWQTIWYQVLPASFGSIITGVILAMSRAIGEAAPLIVVGALAYISFIPASPMDEFSVLPIQIFHWISRPQQGFVVVAAAAIIILLAITFLLNLIAIYLRNKFQNKYN